jgi:hypothetical protein
MRTILKGRTREVIISTEGPVVIICSSTNVKPWIVHVGISIFNWVLVLV